MSACAKCGEEEGTEKMRWGNVYWLCVYCYNVWDRFFKKKFGKTVSGEQDGIAKKDFKKFVANGRKTFVFR